MDKCSAFASSKTVCRLGGRRFEPYVILLLRPMATGNVAWVDYDSKIVALQSLTSALAAKTATGDGRTRRRGSAAKVPVQSHGIVGCSSFEFVFGPGRSQGAGGDGADKVICSIVAASRRGYRCHPT